MKRSSTVVWHGTVKEGKGSISTQSLALDKVSYAWGSRFASKKGTNPEELIAAAHASCYTMKLSALLTEARFVPDEIRTTATVSMEDGTITESHLVVKAKVPGISNEHFIDFAEKSKRECPVSKALNLKITLEASVQLPISAYGVMSEF